MNTCPYTKYAPHTLEGRETWDIVQRCSGQLRFGGLGGVVGIDMAAAFSLAAALGYDTRALAHLFPAAEQGLVQALHRSSDEES